MKARFKLDGAKGSVQGVFLIFVPPGDSADPTRDPAYYDSIFNYLSSVGIPKLS